MTYIETELNDFTRFKKPIDKSPAEVALEAVNIVGSYIQYDDDIYRADLALKKEKGNCYAWAHLGAIVLESWGIQSSIVLDRTHAHLATKIHDEILFVDPIPGKVNDLTREAVQRIGLQSNFGLVSAYRNTLPKALEHSETILFIRQEIGHEKADWKVDRRTTIAPGVPEKNYKTDTAHIVFDATMAPDVLYAIGDLRRYYVTDSPKYTERYDELKQYIPDFINVSW